MNGTTLGASLPDEGGLVTWIRFALTFLVVLGLAYGTARLLGQRLPGGGGGFRLLGHLPLGGRRALLLVRTGDRLFVLGMTDHQITLLDSRPAPAEEAEEERTPPPVDPWRALARWIRSRASRQGGSSA